MHWRRIARVLSLLMLVAIGAAAFAVLSSRPAREGTLALPGLEAAVEIRFDLRARPYVRAASLEDALFAEGFLHARERLWQMELLRRAGNGRLAEALGAGMLDADRELWRSGVPQLAETLDRNATTATQRRVARYVAGVNAGIATQRVRPPELLLTRFPLRPFTGRDVFAIGALMAFDSAGNANAEMLRLALAGVLSAEELRAFIPDGSPWQSTPTVVDAHAVIDTLVRRDALDALSRALLPSIALGSNGWCVAPGRSSSGHALFAFDSHDALALPNLFYEVHLFFDKGRSLRGWSAPGMPGVINGFNERIAWGLTNIGDTQDLFVETRDTADPLRFHYGDHVVPARTETIDIPVRGRETPERLVVTHTQHGPLIADDPPISLAWTAHRVGTLGLDALFEMNLATDWTSFHAALARFAAPSTNVTYADVDGHIAFRTAGLLPIRGRGEGLVPQRGDDPAASWMGMVEPGALPQIVDPPRGFVAAANARVNAPGDGPLISADNAPSYRIRRITDVLAASRAHTIETMRALQMDWRNEQAALLLPALLPAIADVATDGPLADARDALRTWSHDPVNAPELAAPLVFERWYVALARELFAARLGDSLWPRVLRETYLLNDAVDRLVVGAPDAPWWQGARDERVRAAFRAAVETLVVAHGTDVSRWRWDAGHAVRFEHELTKAVPVLAVLLSRGPYPWGGGSATVGRARERYDLPGIARYGATVRVVAEMTSPMRVQAVIPGGQSGHPFDSHYADQTPLWLRGEQDVLATSFETATGSRLLLEPAAQPRF